MYIMYTIKLASKLNLDHRTLIVVHFWQLFTGKAHKLKCIHQIRIFTVTHIRITKYSMTESQELPHVSVLYTSTWPFWNKTPSEHMSCECIGMGWAIFLCVESTSKT